MAVELIDEQKQVLQNDKKNMLVSASAGSGKTFIMIEYITSLVKDMQLPISEIVVLTFTKAAAGEMKERLVRSLRGCERSQFIIEQIDALSTANISTIDSYCEKMLKKYANLLGLNESFSVADENISQKIKQDAFERAFSDFYKNEQNDFSTIVEYYKNDKNQVKNIIFEIEKLTDSVYDADEFIEKNLNSSVNFFEKATQFLHNETKTAIKRALEELKKCHLVEFQSKIEKALKNILEAEDIFQMALYCENVVLPKKESVKIIGEEASETIDLCKKKIGNAIKNIVDLHLSDKENIDFQKEGKLEKIVLKLFKNYRKFQNEIKKSKNMLDFGDLERYMSILSEKENLFDGLKYVFIDEYQDTNKLQERIVKNIAKNCNFVAVGDAKQGIYGFRLATCEIFLNDLKTFQNDEDSNVKFLKSNFRSDKKILNFVNSVFDVCMTEQSCGIDYKNSSTLNGLLQIESDTKNVVSIDVVREKKSEIEIPQVYSVKDAVEENDNDYLNEILAIKNRIFEVRKSKIFENGKLRTCEYSDIAILSRNRGSLFNNLEICLQQSGIPVVSSSRGKLIDEVEIKVLLNFLKIAKNIDDEIALLSVLISPFGGFRLEEIAKIKNERSLCEIVKTDAVFEKFLEKLEKFRNNISIFGVRKLLLKIFDEVDYFAYINMKRAHNQINVAVNRFLSAISESEFDFDLPQLISFFESVDIELVSEPSEIEDAVSMLTIHASKGLEYPVVFLIGCDQSFKDKPIKDGNVRIDEDFGLALKFYNLESNEAFESMKMKAISLVEQKKEFAEELMIFYVALTRARNKLFLFGRFNNKMFERRSLFECSSYYDLVFYACRGKIENFVERNEIEIQDGVVATYIDEIVEIKKEESEKHYVEKVDEDAYTKILDYLNFEYNFSGRENFKLKESVTQLSKKDRENVLEKYSNESFSFGAAGVDVGNAYHLALKVIDWENIDGVDQIGAQIEKNSQILGDYREYIDEKKLFENIKKLKPFCENGHIYKEKGFILKEKLCNLIDSKLQDEVMVQGVVDLFIVKNSAITLIDYKYSNSKNSQYLVNTYKNQLKLYKIAIENAFGMPVKEAYLLSLKDAKLIEVEI